MIVSFFETLEIHLSFLTFIFFGEKKRNRMMRNDRNSFFFLLSDKGRLLEKVKFNFIIYCFFFFLDISF